MLISKRQAQTACWSLMLTAFVLAVTPSDPAAGSRLMVENSDSKASLLEFLVEKGDAFAYRYHHSVYRAPVYHQYKITSDHRILLVSVLSTPVVLFSPYPGYLLPYDRGIAHPSGLLEVPIMRVFEDLVIAVGDELTDKNLMIGQRQFSLRQLNAAPESVRVYIKKDVE